MCLSWIGDEKPMLARCIYSLAAARMVALAGNALWVHGWASRGGKLSCVFVSLTLVIYSSLHVHRPVTYLPPCDCMGFWLGCWKSYQARYIMEPYV